MVAASENTTDNEDIEDLIDECEDQGIVKLEEKTYELNPDNETHLYLNKSVYIEGTGDRTIIDGKHSTLYLDVKKEPEPEPGEVVVIGKDALDVRNTGSHIVFKNITFKDLKLISRHKMDFLDCKFINTNFTSKELDNSFDNCVFNESKIELNVYDAFGYRYYAKIINSTFYNSKITSNAHFLIELVGSSRAFMQNGIDLVNTSLISSDVTLSHYNINISSSKFRNSNLKGWSDNVNISNTSLSNPKIDFDYSDIAFEQTNLNNAELKFQAGYYAKGCKVVLNESNFNNTTFVFNENIGSAQSNFMVQNSSVYGCEIKTDDTNIEVDNSTFNKTAMELYFSNLNMKNSVFYNDGSIADTIKTVTEESHIAWENNKQIEISYPCFVNTTYNAENTYFINNSGKYEIKSQDINVDNIHITFDDTKRYYVNDNITFNVKDNKGNPISNFRISIKNPNDNFTVLLFTDENGNANYTLENAGKLNLELYCEPMEFNFKHNAISMQVNLTVNPKISDIKLIKEIKSNKYSKINGFLEVKTISNYTGDLSGLTIVFKVFTGKNFKTYTKKTDSNWKAVLKIPQKLEVGKHKIVVVADGKIMKTTSITIQKADTIVKAPKVTGKFKKSKYFKVTIKNKETKKLLSNVKVKIKVFTGKKFKTYTVKTNKKGLAKINTKTLKTGRHKVIVSSGNNNYKISAKSLITIKN